ncbi:hypothetical protein PoB_005363000 [Plakobranchus ocellatus]|uniref:Uncharacterized protein n=1 Tax=Plakobranchus ocellatus TaxID=259542 RepID=A0AAV4C604_9GAST|nr:hypothetical protein PoB_005363000 [Plakobranchus ocellatus]
MGQWKSIIVDTPNNNYSNGSSNSSNICNRQNAGRNTSDRCPYTWHVRPQSLKIRTADLTCQQLVFVCSVTLCLLNNLAQRDATTVSATKVSMAIVLSTNVYSTH